jgi:hypothetical protein
MAVSRDTSSVSTSSTNAASFSWSHSGAASGVKGVVVWVFDLTSSTDHVSGVTYGGVAMTPVTNGRAVDTAGEPGSSKAYILGAGVPQGTQTVQVTRTNNADVMYGVAVSLLAAKDVGVHATVLLENDGTVAEQAVTDGSPGVNSLRLAGGYFGHQTLPTTGASSTAEQSLDAGANGFAVVRETTAGQGSRSVGFSSGTTDDRAIVHLSVKEVNDLTLALSGIAGTGSVGTASPALSMAISGLAGTSAVGTVTGGVTTEQPFPKMNNFLSIRVSDGISTTERIR